MKQIKNINNYYNSICYSIHCLEQFKPSTHPHGFTWAIWPIPFPLSSCVARPGHSTGHCVWIFSSYRWSWRCQRSSKQTLACRQRKISKCCNTHHCWYEPATGRSGSRAHPLPAYCSWEWAWQVAALVQSPLLLNVKITMLKCKAMVCMLRGRWTEWVRKIDRKLNNAVCSRWEYECTTRHVRFELDSTWYLFVQQ